MHDLILLVVRHLRGIWRFRWWMLSVAWGISIAGWVIVARLPDQYMSTAKVYVDTQSILRPMLGNLALNTFNPQRRIDLITKSLLSRPNLEKVMRMTDMDIKAKTEEDKEDIIDDLLKNISKKGTNRDNFYTIGYTSEDPQLTKEVVKALLTIFMEGNIGDSRKQQDSAMRFLEQQVQEYEERLAAGEEDLKHFKQDNMEYLSNDADGYYTRLNRAREKAIKAKLSLDITAQRVDILQSQIEGEEPVFGLVDETIKIMEHKIDTSKYDNRINALESKLDEMMLRYTDAHPDIIIAKQLLKDLKRQRKKYIEEEKKSIPQTARAQHQKELRDNPVFQQMKLSLADAQTKFAEKETIYNDLQKKVQTLEEKVDKALQVETEQSQLNRDYDLIKQNYEKLVKRLEAAKLGTDVSNQSDAVQFKIIEPPRVPQEPVAPNRILLSSGVLILSFIFGIAIAFLLSLIRPVFDDKVILDDVTDLPSLGIVNMVWTSDQIKNRQVRHISFLFAFTGLILSFGIVLILYMLKINLVSTFVEILGG